MAEVILDYHAIMDAFAAELRAVTKSDGSPAFVDVLAAEPYAAPPHPGPHCYYWYLGRTDSLAGQKTLANVMYSCVFQVTVIWALHDVAALQAWNVEIATIDTAIRRKFRANSTINASVNDLEISDSDVGFIAFGMNARSSQPTHRAIEMQIRLHNLEGEPISATPN